MDKIDVNDKLPENLEWYENQIAGHHPTVISNGLRQIGIIKEKGSNVILKLVQDGVRGKREVAFYERIVKMVSPPVNDHVGRLMHELYHFVPVYYGKRVLRIGHKDIEFLQLEDITAPFHSPCIMDVKMGKVSYDPTASEQKRIAESSKCPFQPIFGFRMLGYRINTIGCESPKSRDRVWGRALTEDNIRSAFEEYFLPGRPSDPATIVELFVERISHIKQWFDRQRLFHFYASSLLLVYEGDATRPAAVDVRMIDFSHVFDAEDLQNSGSNNAAERDENYIHGLDYLLRLLHDILRTLKTPHK